MFDGRRSRLGVILFRNHSFLLRGNDYWGETSIQWATSRNRNLRSTFRRVRYPSVILAWPRIRIPGDGIWNLFNYYSRKFSLKTVLMFADQLIPSLKYIHSKGLIRRDAKPENMLMGDGKQGNKVYIVRDRHRVGEATREADKAGRLSNLIWSE